MGFVTTALMREGRTGGGRRFTNDPVFDVASQDLEEIHSSTVLKKGKHTGISHSLFSFSALFICLYILLAGY